MNLNSPQRYIPKNEQLNVSTQQGTVITLRQGVSLQTGNGNLITYGRPGSFVIDQTGSINSSDQRRIEEFPLERRSSNDHSGMSPERAWSLGGLPLSVLEDNLFLTGLILERINEVLGIKMPFTGILINQVFRSTDLGNGRAQDAQKIAELVESGCRRLKEPITDPETIRRSVSSMLDNMRLPFARRRKPMLRSEVLEAGGQWPTEQYEF